MRLPLIPAGFFSMVLGIAGLGTAWRQATRVWGLPSLVGDSLMLIAACVWAVLAALYGAKLFCARDLALEEARHPIQCCFVGLIGVATMLVAVAGLPYSKSGSMIVFVLGLAMTVTFAAWRTGALWKGGRDPTATTAVLYLPTVGGSFVAASGLAGFGYPDWGQLAFGAGLFSWLAIESVLLQRLYTSPALPLALRSTLGIQLAPSTVGLVAYLNVTAGPPGLPAHALLGYGLLQALVLLRLAPWLRQQQFAPTYWGFTFGLSAIGTAPLMMVIRGETGPAAILAPYLFVMSNVLIGAILAATVVLAWKGKLLPTPPAST